VDGIINKHSADSSLEKINDAVLDQNFVGRLLGYGDLDILTAAEQEVDHYRMLNQAPTFKKEMLNQKHALETDLARMPSPPLRAFGLIFLVSFPVHEFSHALAAYRLGDGTAKMFGRLTLNPIAHFDPIGALLLVVAGFGWAKPTPINPRNLRGGRQGEGIVAAAGPASNLVLATAAALPVRYINMTGMEVPPLFQNSLSAFVLFNVILFVFNLIPIPPLDGSKVLFSLLDPRTVYQIRPTLEQYGFVLLILLAFIPIGREGTVVGIVFNSVAIPLAELLTGGPLTFV